MLDKNIMQVKKNKNGLTTGRIIKFMSLKEMGEMYIQ